MDTATWLTSIFKNPKHLIELFDADHFPGGCWEDLHAYNWFVGL